MLQFFVKIIYVFYQNTFLNSLIDLFQGKIEKSCLTYNIVTTEGVTSE